MRTWSKPPGFGVPGKTSELQELTLRCRFISPVFGGGVDPKRVDPVTPVRVSAIRGQLRFWWRATHANLSLEKLRDSEVKLFGGVHGDKPTPSAISIDVSKQPQRMKRLEVFLRGNAFKLADDRLGALAYGAFPLRGLDPAKTHAPLFVYDDPFELVIRTRPAEGIDVRAELDRALWAWLHFGGLGGRTRRGFGALQLDHASHWTLASIADGWPREPREDAVAWAVLPTSATGVRTAKTTTKTGTEAQEKLLELLWRMRQGDVGRKPNRPRPGRSYWPEPDAIRQIQEIRSGRHGQPIHQPRIDKFPRAAFGMPIIFHFKTEGSEREPTDTTLVPAVVKEDENGQRKLKPLGRLASSLILRPHAAGGVYEPMALRLDHPAPAAWRLLGKKRDKDGTPQVVTLDPSEANRIAPLHVGTKAYTNPIDAYLAWLETI